MKVTVDTNVLVRAVVQDHPVQAQQAGTVLLDAALIAVTLPALCELVWVLRQATQYSRLFHDAFGAS